METITMSTTLDELFAALLDELDEEAKRNLLACILGKLSGHQEGGESDP